MQSGFQLDYNELQKYQPNRYPFLMIDFVTDVVPGVHAKGFKNLSMNEWFFPIHFPNSPNMPGALQLESMAQMLTVAITTLPGLEGKVTHAISHKVNFKKEVKPGDKLVIEAYLKNWQRGIAQGIAYGLVNKAIVCEAEMKITIPEILQTFTPRTQMK